MATNNTEEKEDFLTEDAEISSQKIVLLSFLSPEKILEDKNVFLFQQFLKDYDLQWRTSKLEGWMAEQLGLVNNRLEKLAGSLETMDLSGAAVEVRSNQLRVDRFVEEFQVHQRSVLKDQTTSKLREEYENFLFKHSEKLEEEFFAKNNFRTTIRGIKVRGVFSNEAEAAAKAKRLQKADPTFNIYAGKVGKWMAWEPDPNKVVEQEYANDQLNTLMQKYRENEEARDSFYTEQKNRRMASAPSSESNRKEEEESGKEGVASLKLNSGQYDGMFSGSEDLFIQKKNEERL
jgi:hypothetical protein